MKNILLNLLAYRITRQLKERDISYGYLLGVMTSGNMNIERIKRILPHFIAYAEKQNRILEVLFHPGQMREEEVGIAQNKKSVTEFYLSNNRNVEWECINGLEEYI